MIIIDEYDTPIEEGYSKVCRSLTEDPSIIYSLLAVAGYLRVSKKELQGDGSYLCEVEIPNRETVTVYKSEILSRMRLKSNSNGKKK